MPARRSGDAPTGSCAASSRPGSTRLRRLAGTDPELLEAQEALRQRCMYPSQLDQKTVQLILFAVLLSHRQDAARTHGIAARRAGASWGELQATVHHAFLFGGYSVANFGAEVLDALVDAKSGP